MNLALSIVLQASMVATSHQGYTEAYHKTKDTGKPLVVLVGADWCPGCVLMKNRIMPQLEKKGGLKNVEIAYVNTDQDTRLAGQLMSGGTIPQLIVYKKTTKGWARQQLVGAHSVGETKQFIDLNAKAQAAKTAAKTASTAKK